MELSPFVPACITPSTRHISRAFQWRYLEGNFLAFYFTDKELLLIDTRITEILWRYGMWQIPIKIGYIRRAGDVLSVLIGRDALTVVTSWWSWRTDGRDVLVVMTYISACDVLTVITHWGPRRIVLETYWRLDLLTVMTRYLTVVN